MAINPSTLLRHIKATLGSVTRPLPITDEEILAIIEEETLPTFSNFYPYFYKIMVNPTTDTLRDPNNVPTEGIFVINANNLEVLGVAAVHRGDGLRSQVYNMYPYYGTNNIFDIAIGNNYLSMVETPETFAYYPPNQVELFPKYLGDEPFLVTVKCIHPNSYVTIPLNLKEEFYSLAEYDVKIALLPILKHYDQLNTPFGSIDLKINDLEDAIGKREELVEKFRTMFMKEASRRKIWIK